MRRGMQQQARQSERKREPAVREEKKRNEEELFQKDKSASTTSFLLCHSFTKSQNENSLSLLFSSLTLAPSHALDRREKKEEEE